MVGSRVPALLACASLLIAADRPSALLRRMTLDEKISLVHGARDPRELGGAGYWPGVPRLKIPPLRFADGPSGINVNRDATAMPAPVVLAATFNPEAARAYGVVLGREARALEQDVLLAPYVNIVRDPLFRRNHTAFSEDPLLTSRIGVAQIAGIQSQGVMAQVKHLVAYHGAASVEIDERELQELYLPPFEAAVRAGVASVMCAYTRVNGRWACEQPVLLNEVLRRQWGFPGFVTSDWGATHSTRAIMDGLDLEMPGRVIEGRPAGPYFTEALKEAVPVAAIDTAVLRILRQMERFHMLDGRRAPAAPIDIEADARVARQVAEQGAVLLKNDDGVLPLADLDSLAVIGPTAGQLAVGYMGERAYGFVSRFVAPVVALGPKPRYSVGVDLTGVPIPGDRVTTEAGDYTFLVQSNPREGAEGGGAITVDGRLAVRSSGINFGGTGMNAKKWSSLLPTRDGWDNARATLRLTAGTHTIAMERVSTGEVPLDVRFAWITPAMRRGGIDAAVEAARGARTAVVFAWHVMGTTLALPEDQDELIRRVAEANARTIVVLNSGGPVAMPWLGQVKAVLEMWYPGQEGGPATADLLTGKSNPSSKLPVRFEPAFPFGHGLSYTRFEYSDLKITPGGEVSFTLRNAGNRSGAEVAQVYAGALAGFARVELEPGSSRRVSISIDPRLLSRPLSVGSSSRDIRLSSAGVLR